MSDSALGTGSESNQGDFTVRILDKDEAAALDNVAPEVFDRAINEQWRTQFFGDARHHLAVAIRNGQVVGMASAVHYVHPDKPPELWINEVGVAPTHRKLGLAKRLLSVLIVHGRELGCCNAWVLTDRDNVAARALYAALGGVETHSLTYSFGLDRDPNQ